MSVSVIRGLCRACICTQAYPVRIFVKKLLATLIAAALAVGTLSTMSVKAADENVVKTSQMAVEYADKLDQDSINDPQKCDVEASIGSQFFVVIPKLITLGADGEAFYTVTVDADLAGTDYIEVLPAAKEGGYLLREDGGKADIPYTVSQDKTRFIADGSVAEFDGATTANTEELKASVEGYTIVNEEAAIVDGSVSAPSITAGLWTGAFNFDIALKSKTTVTE